MSNSGTGKFRPNKFIENSTTKMVKKIFYTYLILLVLPLNWLIVTSYAELIRPSQL